MTSEPPVHVSPPESVWGAEIDAWAEAPAVGVVEHATPHDDLLAVLERAIDRALARPGRVTPLTHRARVVLAPGTYRQGISLAYAWKSNVAVELVAPSRDVIIDPDDDVAALEHAGISCLVVGITFRKSRGDAWAVHGSGRAGIARELIMHDCKIEALNGAQAFSHENAAGHILYMSKVRVTGSIYQHTIRTGHAEPTLAIWDSCTGELADFADESVHRGDLLLIRGGALSNEDFSVAFQRTGSPMKSCLSAVIDASSGIRRTNSRRVEFGNPEVEKFPILTKNPRMVAAYRGVA